MALANNKELLEYGKFRDTGSGTNAIAVVNPDGSSITGTGGGTSVVKGDTANGVADASNTPVGVGGRYLVTPSTYADGNRVNWLFDVNGRGQVLPYTPPSAIAGQAKVAVTNTAIQLGSATLTNGIIVHAKSTNAQAITIGGSGVTNTVDGTGNGVILSPGDAMSFAVTNPNVLYFNGTSGDIISYCGS